MKHYAVVGFITPCQFNFDLFTVDNKPMEFYLDGFDQGDLMATARVIEAFGGKLSNSRTPGTIILSAPNQSSQLPGNHYYDMKFVVESVAMQKLQELDKYRLNQPKDDDTANEHHLGSPSAKRRRGRRKKHNTTNDTEISLENAASHDITVQQKPQQTEKILSSHSSPEPGPSSSKNDRPLASSKVDVEPREHQALPDEISVVPDMNHASNTEAQSKVILQSPEKGDDPEINSPGHNGLPKPQNGKNPQVSNAATETSEEMEDNKENEENIIGEKTPRINHDLSAENVKNKHYVVTLHEFAKYPSQSDESFETTDSNENFADDSKTSELFNDNKLLDTSIASSHSSIIDQQSSSPKANESVELGDSVLHPDSITAEVTGGSRSAGAIIAEVSQSVHEENVDTEPSTPEMRSTPTIARRTRARAVKKPYSPKTNRSAQFSEEDNQRMVQYLIDHNVVSEGSKQATWREFRQTQVLQKPGVSAVALTDHFRNFLKKNAHQYTSDPQILMQFHETKPHGSRTEFWSEAELKAMIDFLMKNHFEKDDSWMKIWVQCLDQTPLLQAHNRTAKAICTKYQRYLRFNYRQITNDPAVAMKIETMEIERSIK